jgi:hypothetical protein
MTTMRQAVSKVSRLLGVTMAGQEPTGHDAADILEHMQGVIDRLPLFRNGEWDDVLLTDASAYEASDGERISPQGFDPVITLPTTYEDDCGNTKIMEDLSRVHVIGDGFYVWASDLASWNKTDSLAASDTFPFGAADLQAIIALTVVEAAPEYEATVSPVTVARAQAGLNSFSARFYREVISPPDNGVLRMSDTGYRGGFY